MTNRSCDGCGHPTRPNKSDPADYPGTEPMHGHGLCVRCYGQFRRGTLGRRVERRVVVQREARIENIEWLLTYDRNAEAVATRSGFTNAATAVRSLQRWGRHDLANTLRRYA